MSERKLSFVNPVLFSLLLASLSAGVQAAPPLSMPGPDLAVMAAGAEDGLPLKDVRVDAQKQVVFVFSTSGAVPPVPRITELDSSRLIMDFQGVGLDGDIPLSDELTQRISKAIPGVKSVRYGMVLNSKVPILRFNFEILEGANFKARVAKQEDGAITISLKDDWGAGTAQIAQALQSQSDGGTTSAYDAYFQQFKAQKQETSSLGKEWGPRKGTISELKDGKPVVKPITTKSAWITGMFKKALDKSNAEAKTAAAARSSQAADTQPAQAPAQTAAPAPQTAVQPEVETQPEPVAAAHAPVVSEVESNTAAPEVKAAASQPLETTTPVQTNPAAEAVSMDATTPDTSLVPSAQEEQKTEPPADKSGWESEKPAPAPVKAAVGSGEAPIKTAAANPRHVVQKAATTSPVAAKPAVLAADEMQEAPAPEAPAQEAIKQEANRQEAAEQPAESAAETRPAETKTADADPGESPQVKARRLYNKAVEEHKRGRLAEAVAGYKAALALNTELSDAHSNLGLAYNQQHNYASALSEFHKALAVNASDAITYNGIGAALRAEKDINGAIKQWETAVRLDPKLAVAHYNLGTAYESQGELDRALVSYDNAVKTDPHLGEAYYRMGLILQKRHRLDEAKEHYRKSLKYSDDSEYTKDARDRLALLDKKPVTK